MTQTYRTPYSPYGAFELKSRYQRNFLIGTGSSAFLVLAILFTFWLTGSLNGQPPNEPATPDGGGVIVIHPPQIVIGARPDIRPGRPTPADIEGGIESGR